MYVNINHHEPKIITTAYHRVQLGRGGGEGGLCEAGARGPQRLQEAARRQDTQAQQEGRDNE